MANVAYRQRERVTLEAVRRAHRRLFSSEEVSSNDRASVFGCSGVLLSSSNNYTPRKVINVRSGFLIVLVLVCASITLDQSAHAKKPNWISLFNGKDLAGWHLRNPAGVNGWKIQNGV
jgi:hypothetical protein